MKKFLLSCVLTSALAAGAFAAPRAADLAAAVVRGGTWIEIGIRDVNALRKSSSDSLLARALALVPSQFSVDSYGDVDLRATPAPDFKGVGKFVLAAELKGAIPWLDSFSVKAPDFSAVSPAGTTLTPLGVTEDENVGKINMALLERDGARYLICANGDPALLTAMAAAPEGGSGASAHTSGHVWTKVRLEEDVFAAQGIDMPAGLDIELGLTDTASSLKLVLWSNAVDLLSRFAGKDLRGVFDGGAPSAAPLLFGRAPLVALLNVSASFLPEDFRLSDALPGELAELGDNAEREAVRELSPLGLSWEELVGIMRGNITLGLAGKVDAPMVGIIPGVYLNVAGADAAKAAALVEMCASELGGAFGGLEPYEADGWKGYRFGGVVPGLLASGERGLLAAVMNPDQLGGIPEVGAGMEIALEPRGFALALNTKKLRPVLKKLFEMYGDRMFGGDVDKNLIRDVIDNMNIFDAVSLALEDADTAVLEMTPNADLVNLFLPARETSETAPAA